MNASLRLVDGDKEVLRWGGLAGVLGSVSFILGFVVVGVFLGSGPGLERDVMRFPDISAARTAENTLYFGALVLWTALFLGLYRALRGTSLAPALLGSAIGVLGLTVLAAGAFPQVATAPLSDLYHAPGATPVDQASLVVAWQATLGVFNALLVAGLLLVPIGMAVLGIAMLGAPAFGRRYGWLSVALGIGALVSGYATLVDPSSPIAVVGFFALIIAHLVLGWKLYRLSSALSAA